MTTSGDVVEADAEVVGTGCTGTLLGCGGGGGGRGDAAAEEVDAAEFTSVGVVWVATELLGR